MSSMSWSSASHRTVQRLILPVEDDPEVLPLYVTSGSGAPVSARSEGYGFDAPPAVVLQGSQPVPGTVLGRQAFEAVPGGRTSFATYFNAFPAGYWRRWTTVESVRLVLCVEGSATVAVYRSTASGSIERVSIVNLADDQDELCLDLELAPFIDGGWYWFDLITGSETARLVRADWQVPVPPTVAPATTEASITIGITSCDRGPFVVRLLGQLAQDPEVVASLERVLVVDQGQHSVRDAPGFDEAAAALGPCLQVIEQANLGGSGGFARAMSEAVESSSSRYVLLLDDDISLEPEGILRGLAFADLCRRPTIVGGHMFNYYARSQLHSLGERVNRWRFFWGPARSIEEGHDFAVEGLRETPWLHRRVDSDYTGWWMCLIPTEVVQKIGLALPFFIKWDDAEYGLRAMEAGIPTVTLPGVAVWHIPWSAKDDALDWQAYFHQRNRIVAALLHSPYPRGGRLVRESLNHQIKHLLSMQYSVAELRMLAIEDVLAGPEGMHRQLSERLSQVRALRSRHTDANTKADIDAFPMPKGENLRSRGRETSPPRHKPAMIARAAWGAVRQLDLRRSTPERPQVAVPAGEAQWWNLVGLDSALVSTMDGRAAAWYQRDPAMFVQLMARSVAGHRRLLQEWPELSRRYREAAPSLASADAWRDTFAESVAEGQ